MKYILLTVITVILSLTRLIAVPGPSPVTQKKVVIGYIAGFRGLRGLDTVQAKKLTHINYAFAVIKNNRVFLPRMVTDTTNLRNLHNLLQQNLSLKILVSIGGWAGSHDFSDAAFSDTSRNAFAASAAALVQEFNLDGIDIDWEYPGMEGAGNIYREVDKQNFTLMLKALREKLDIVAAKQKKRMLLTIAAGADTSFLLHTEMKKAQQYLDYVNLMTYDFKTEEDSIAGHHANLYDSKVSASSSSSNRSVINYIRAGVPPSKIVQGVAFYARAWKMKSAIHNGLNAPSVSPARGAGFTLLKDSILSKSAYAKYWDEEAQAPYLFNATDSIFMSYDDERSIKQKCLYVQQKNLAGIMFWEYYSDYKGYLLDVIDKQFHSIRPASK